MSRRSAGRAVEAIVFDLDDTLIDWWGSIEQCLTRFAAPDVVAALQAHCRSEFWEFRPGSTDIWHRNTWALHTRREAAWPTALDFLDPDERTGLMERFADELWVDFFGDTVATLDRLADDYRLGVLSNNEHLDAEARRLGLHAWFEFLHVAPAHRPKPHPDGFLDAASTLGLSPSRCAFVGDSVRADVLGARGAGMVPVWLDRWGDRWPERPEGIHRIGTLAQLPDLLAGLGGRR